MRSMLGFAAATALAVSVTAAAQAETVFKTVVHADLKNIDPIWTTATITLNHGYQIWDTLFAVNEKFEVQPQMAESYEVSDDGTVYTITLRDGLKWHDGSPVTAADRAAEKIILEALAKKAPQIAVVSEENERSHGLAAPDRFFLVDPLDGTKEFLKKDEAGAFTVNIALIENGRPVRKKVVYENLRLVITLRYKNEVGKTESLVLRS